MRLVNASGRELPLIRTRKKIEDRGVERRGEENREGEAKRSKRQRTQFMARDERRNTETKQTKKQHWQRRLTADGWRLAGG